MSKKNKRQEKNADHWIEDNINLMKEVESACSGLDKVNDCIRELRDMSLSDIRVLESMECQLKSAFDRCMERFVTTDHIYDIKATKHTEYSQEVQYKLLQAVKETKKKK